MSLRPWSVADVESLRELAGSGRSAAQIAVMLGRTPGAIKSKARKRFISIPAGRRRTLRFTAGESGVPARKPGIPGLMALPATRTFRRNGIETNRLTARGFWLAFAICAKAPAALSEDDVFASIWGEPEDGGPDCARGCAAVALTAVRRELRPLGVRFISDWARGYAAHDVLPSAIPIERPALATLPASAGSISLGDANRLDAKSAQNLGHQNANPDRPVTVSVLHVESLPGVDANQQQEPGQCLLPSRIKLSPRSVSL